VSDKETPQNLESSHKAPSSTSLNVLKDVSWLVPFESRNTGTLWQVVKAYLANKRQGTASTKTRAQVRSTGKKPYKQKKTGNARRGSFVSPICVGGGVAHGPKPRDHRQAILPKMAKVALGIILSKRMNLGLVYETSFASLQTGRTKDAFSLIREPESIKGKILVSIGDMSPTYVNAIKNLDNVMLVPPQQLNALHVIQSRALVLNNEALDIIQKRLSV
jgi:large subunit ribosomal protein L4